ncbi:FMN-binding protein [Burkholderia ubonensis]|uniref:FMN-binding protein n=1 Tax=Burkholderia ubonensis TaxID=101571 RepID=UPI00075AB134|nr:FMN-binding protein [Burkholderia ubonensis]KVS41490.1 FMN-binding protein [Burkholderia ubonensis]KVS53875.1 FMN-binding protein [Burkholderia ubonensis]KVS70027.1 FMN-binding protein [Burkholderia ubonensis]KVS85067.1 FMN-binding protein [Burkholderia ubonensis]KVS90671.1 FMN-binding protein [Burkholderia ubonensis]
MKWMPFAVLPVALAAAPAYAVEYLSVAQAQAAMFPGAALSPVLLKLPDTVRDAMLERSGVHEPFDEKGVWKAPDGGWFVLDKVVGKHEKIAYAVALNANGSVRGIDILSYQETYGAEVRNADWRAQFVGKTSHDAVQLGKDVRNISGATLSCKHITQGVKRVLTLHELVLARM